jgi:hypothetical protein
MTMTPPVLFAMSIMSILTRLLLVLLRVSSIARSRIVVVRCLRLL